MVDLTGPVLQGILYAFFALLTTILSAITLPTYQNLLVPELSAASLYPSLTGGDGFLGQSAIFSEYLLVRLVDPAIVLVALALGLLYLARSAFGFEGLRLEGALPRLVVSVVLANLTVPVAGTLLALGGAIFPTVAGFDGGAWQYWTELNGGGPGRFAWDNGALAFIVTFAMFSLVLLLAIAVALRDALIAFLLVVLPVLTLLGAVPILQPLARRGWFLFAEATFWPCVLVIPLELAVGSTSELELLAYLTLALGSPALISMAGTSLTQLGLPSASGALSGGVQRGLAVASLGASSYSRPLTSARGSGNATAAFAATAGAAGRVPLPLSAPIAAAELVGHGASHLLRHLTRASRPARPGSASAFRAFRPIHR